MVNKQKHVNKQEAGIIKLGLWMWKGGGGGGGEVPMSCVKISKKAMSNVFVAKRWPFPLSILRNTPVACHYNSKVFCHVAHPTCGI